MTAERLIASPAVIFGFANVLNVSFQIPTSDIQRSEHGHVKGYGKEFGIN